MSLPLTISGFQFDEKGSFFMELHNIRLVWLGIESQQCLVYHQTKPSNIKTICSLTDNYIHPFGRTKINQKLQGALNLIKFHCIGSFLCNVKKSQRKREEVSKFTANDLFILSFPT